MNETIEYYNKNAAQFIAGTKDADMSEMRDRFLHYIAPGGRILDAGCGSGRDSLVFLHSGFQVDAFDASEEICRLASERLGFKVTCRRFEDLEGAEEYDGIWCCASLLHVAADNLPDVMKRLYKLLRPEGVIYVSFKEGDKEWTKEGRYFHNMTSNGCKELLEDSGFLKMEIFETGDVREGRNSEKWVNAIARKIIRKDSPRCLYHNSFEAFLRETEYNVLGALCDRYHGEARTTTREAWKEEILIMRDILSRFDEKEGQIIFEYDIPRLGKRIDVVLLLRGIIFCLEFKVGETRILEADVDQVLDYALDLKNFHRFSREKVIAPILVATNYTEASSVIQMSVYNDRVINPLVTGKEQLYEQITSVLKKYPNETPVDYNWIISPYAPTPTIIEAARSLYKNHSVEDITRHEADKVYTDRTIGYILQVIKKSKDEKRKSICFVTGVPGAGKTLVGLDVAIKQTYQGHDEPVEDEGAVYLSGNGPLVAVLTEALAQDDYKKGRENNEPKKLSDSRRKVGQSIQMIHRYRDNMLAKIKNPVENGILEIDPEKAVKMEKAGFGEVEHVAIFDEAQRSWTHKRLADYLKRGGTYGNKLKVPNFPMSEAAFLIWSLDQREDWATIVCLVGGGQEINTGEAGISEWIAALNQMFPQWDVYISPKLIDAEYAEGKVNELLKDKPNVTYSESLHLAVSLRSYRAEKLSAFVHALLSFDGNAAKLYAEIKDHYPIVLTRDMEKARKWLHEKVRGTERTGVLVTKEAARFKPLAIHILPPGDENAVHWFLEDKADTRSSNYLEDAATEIQVQGLELDYTCVLWDADMRYEDGKWRFYNFNGNTRWNEITGDSESKQEKVKYMLNAYRVLLTRARVGMIICVPEGNPNKTASGFWEDSTRLPEYYDGTYRYLKNIGIEEI